jgi:hypothetical protein
MNKKETLTLAMQQIETTLDLLKGNDYETYMNLKLISVYYELQRQLDKLF